MTQGTDFDFRNYPADGTEGELREIIFGSGSDTFSLLIEVDPSGGPLQMTVGNGPPHEDAPRALAEVLRDMAELVESMEDNEEYWNALDALGNTE